MTDYEKICDFENLYKAHKHARCCKRHKKDVILFEMNLAENRGLPMGNQTSQLFALYYLDPLDRFIKEELRIKYYVRYMDDLVLLSDDKEYLKDCLKNMQSLVNNQLKLAFNNKTQIFPIKNGVDFLGFHFYLTDSGKIIKKLRRSSKIRFKNRLKKLQYGYKTGRIQLDDINMSLASYYGHLKHGNTYKLRTSVFSKTKFFKLTNK